MKILFVDDNSRRIHAAIKRWGNDVTVAPNVKEALRLISSQEWDVISLDFDLNGDDFTDPESKNCGMEIVRHMKYSEWPRNRKEPGIIIHSTNQFGAGLMFDCLNRMGLNVVKCQFRYDSGEYRNGVIAGAFDVIHPGYIRLFKDAKKVCGYLIIALHEVPDHKKYKPILTVEERKEILLAIKYVDQVIPYKTENDLTRILESFNQLVYIRGSDHENSARKQFPSYIHQRNHDWSTTKFKKMIAESIRE